MSAPLNPNSNHYRQQYGFGMVVIVMMVAVVLILSAASYLVLKPHFNTSTSTPNAGASSIKGTKTFNGGFGVNWASFEYPKGWNVAPDPTTYSTVDQSKPDEVGPGIIITSPSYNPDKGRGSYIAINSTKTFYGSIAYWKSVQGQDDPNGTFGDFTFNGKAATIFNASTALDPEKRPALGLADMYKGADTWIQGNGIIYTVFGSVVNPLNGDSFYAKDQADLYSALKIVLDSWKWQ